MKVQRSCTLALALSTIAPATASPVQQTKHLPTHATSRHLRPVLERGRPERLEKRQSGFAAGQPYDGKGKGSVFSGGTSHYLDVTHPDNLGAESTDNGVSPVLLHGGWTREQVVTDLPASTDIAGAQQHLTKGSIRELHWHRVAEWGIVYAGSLTIAAVDDQGRNQVATLQEGDIWYFPKGQAHTVQGLEGANEFLLIFDDGNFDATGTTFMVDDWISHTPKDILAKNFGLNASVFADVPTPNPYITNATVVQQEVEHPYGELSGNSSYVYFASQVEATQAPGGGGSIKVVDSTVFPIATTIASAIVELQPGALRELHWHPDAEEWLYFLEGEAKATVFIGGASARTFDFSAGDTAVFPTNAGHYVENTGNTTLSWVEIYKSDRVVDISLTQWLALTPSHIVAQVLHVDEAVIQNLKKEKQLIIA